MNQPTLQLIQNMEAEIQRERNFAQAMFDGFREHEETIEQQKAMIISLRARLALQDEKKALNRWEWACIGIVMLSGWITAGAFWWWR